MPAIGGSVSIEGEAQKNCQSPLKSLRPCSISVASGSAVMRKLSAVRGDDRCTPSAHGAVYVTFLDANVALRLSNNSTFTPLRRMMKLCCSTDSVLFQAQ